MHAKRWSEVLKWLTSSDSPHFFALGVCASYGGSAGDPRAVVGSDGNKNTALTRKRLA